MSPCHILGFCVWLVVGTPLINVAQLHGCTYVELKGLRNLVARSPLSAIELKIKVNI